MTTQTQQENVNGIDVAALKHAIADIDPSVARGYERLHYTVRLAGGGTQEQFEKMHEVVQRTSPNYYNIANPIELTSELVVEL